jgi:hypothetical protein
MKLVRFWTKHGWKVVGGRFDFARSPSTVEEFDAPVGAVDGGMIKEAEEEHDLAIERMRESWSLGS